MLPRVAALETVLQGPREGSGGGGRNLGCVNCGGKDGPLCARLNRDFIIGFTGHGASKKKIENDQRGGCYAAGGNVAIHWRATAGQEQEQSDSDKLRAFVKTLSPRAVIRHHVAGDIGAE